MQTRGIEMSQLYTLVRDTTKLTDVQAKILDHMQVALQLASDISRNQVYLCARGKNDDISVVDEDAKRTFPCERLARHIRPEFRRTNMPR